MIFYITIAFKFCILDFKILNLIFFYFLNYFFNQQIVIFNSITRVETNINRSFL